MATQTLLSSGTTFVSSLLPNTNLSINPIIVTGTSPVYLDTASYLKFDVSSIPVQAVDSAVLRLFVFTKTGGPPSPVVVDRVTSDFDMASITYNMQPTYVPTTSSINITAANVIQYVEIDVTALVNQWLDGTYQNYGIALTDSDGITSVEFGGKPIGASSEPQLVVTYTPGPTADLHGIQAQLQGSPAAILADEAKIIFDTVVIDASDQISYDTNTGDFTISAPGNYYVNWWVTTDGSAGPVNVVFGLFVNGSSVSIGNAPVITGQVEGNAFLSVSTAPATVSLVNQTGASILLANTLAQADITIITARITQ